jgi:hypothetical protein
MNQINQINKTNQSNQTNQRGREAIIRRFTRSRNRSGEWCNGTSFGLNELEALLMVVREAKEWIATHTLKS